MSLMSNDITATDIPDNIQNSDFGHGFQSGLRNTWIITTEDPNAIVTLKVRAMATVLV